VSGKEFAAKIDKATGALTSYRLAGREMLAAPLEPNFWKAPNDNQYRSSYLGTVAPWRNATAGRRITAVEADQPSPDTARVIVRAILPVGQSPYTVTYRFGGGGRIDVLAEYRPGSDKNPLLPRFGMKLAVPRAYNQVTWYGRGPQETYWDRKTGGEIAIFRKPVEEMVHPYVRTQDTGNRTDTRWFTVTDDRGAGLRLVGAEPISFSVWPFTIDDVMAAAHPYELPRREFNTVFVDWRLHGVGGDDSWGALTHPEYTLPGNQPYRLAFAIVPAAPR